MTRISSRRLLPAVLAALSVSSVASFASAAAPSANDSESADALLEDTKVLVHAAETFGWFLDAEEYREIYPVLLESTCRVSEEARALAVRRLTSLKSQRGDPAKLFEQASREWTDEATKAVKIHRQLHALKQAVVGAEKSCPFWIDAETPFLGLQSPSRKFTLSLETGGLLQFRRTEGDFTFGGGGAARVLPGYGIGESLSVLAGIEFGGGAMLRTDTSDTQFVLNYFPAIPMVLRFRSTSWHIDSEIAGVGLFQANDPSLSYGVRVGGGFGLSVPRARGLLPWAGVVLAVEHFVPSGGRPSAQFLRGGIRLGFRWPP